MARAKKTEPVVDKEQKNAETTEQKSSVETPADDKIVDEQKTVETIEKPTPKKAEWVFNPNEKTNVRNITNIGISVILENTVGRRGEIFIPAKQARPINNEEIMIKIESQNPSFCGIDGLGANASLYIEDKEFREYLDFESENERQAILSDDVLNNIFNAEKLTTFKSLIKKSVITYAEKDKLISYLREKFDSGEFDSASKIDFVESYTGLKIKG